MKRKLEKCPKCGENSFFWVEEGKALEDIEFQEITKKLKAILKNRKAGIYEKKIALFDWLKTLKLGELESDKEQRINYLLQSRLYNELAKKSMEEYKKSTVGDYSKES